MTVIKIWNLSLKQVASPVKQVILENSTNFIGQLTEMRYHYERIFHFLYIINRFGFAVRNKWSDFFYKCQMILL